MNPFRIATLQGGELDLLAASPAMVRQWFYRELNQHRADLYVRERSGPDGFREGIDLVSITRVLNSSGKQALRPEEKAILTAAFTGGLLTMTRLHGWGLVASELCPWCGKPDTLTHRLLHQECGDEQLRKLRKELKMEQLINDAGGSTAGGQNPLWLERLEVPAAHQPAKTMCSKSGRS